MLEAKPFLKWAGGKRQLLSDLVSRLPQSIQKSKEIERYIEPFVGGGALFFYLKSNYKIKQSYLLDINNDLILTYKVIQKRSKELIALLNILQKKYSKLDLPKQKKFFYKERTRFNEMLLNFDFDKYNSQWIERAALVIFLNRTCFNGLFRQNSKGFFNVPFGKNSHPTICDEENIKAVAKALVNTEIICGDFSKSTKFVSKNTFIYLDPPYRPIIKTSFTKYSKDGFVDSDQVRLSQYFKKMSNKKAYLMLSNSDPKNNNKKDNYFDELYNEFKVHRVFSKRSINSNGRSRGKISEIIVTNYER